MAFNGVVPSRHRILNDKDEFVSFGGFMQTPAMPDLVARGVLPFEYLELGDRFKGCLEASHVRDVLMAEGVYPRPSNEEWRVSYDRRIRASRERVKKRRQRA